MSELPVDDVLFDIEQPPPISLAQKFGVPPMSVLDRRAGVWQDRKRRWLSMGIQSEVGRSAAAVSITAPGRDDFLARLLRGEEPGMTPLAADGVSIFDPVVCELAYRWFSNPGDRVLDPFAGGSVRGVTASTLLRAYTGVDLRAEQIAANESQAHLCSAVRPRWVEGDSMLLRTLLAPDEEFDLVLTCPPYGDLEVYSDDPRDLSTLDAEEFDARHACIIARTCERLRSNRFAVWVISDIRDRRGAYRGLVGDTIAAFRRAGLTLHNDLILLDPVGTAAVRAERPFRSTRKVTRVHQHMLIFLKGDARVATDRLTEDIGGELV